MEILTAILTSPTMIVAWPIAFVLIQALSIAGSSDLTIAKGKEKYKVWYLDTRAKRPDSGPATVERIVNLFNQGKKIIEISRLEDSILNIFSFGRDLCVGALATDVSAIFALSSYDPHLVQAFASLFVLHLALLMLIVFALRPLAKPSTWVVWIANLVGIMGLVPFIWFGGLLIK